MKRSKPGKPWGGTFPFGIASGGWAQLLDFAEPLGHGEDLLALEHSRDREKVEDMSPSSPLLTERRNPLQLELVGQQWLLREGQALRSRGEHPDLSVATLDHNRVQGSIDPSIASSTEETQDCPAFCISPRLRRERVDQSGVLRRHLAHSCQQRLRKCGQTFCVSQRLMNADERLTLQYLEILQICVLRVRIELDSRHGDIVCCMGR